MNDFSVVDRRIEPWHGLGAALALVLVLAGAMAVPAAAAAGDAEAAAARASLSGTVLGIPINLVDETLADVAVAQGDEAAEATDTLLDVDLPVGTVALVSAATVSSTASSDHVRAEATSTLSGAVVDLGLPGLPQLLAVDQISTRATCHVVEPPDAEAGPPTTATLLGVPIEVELGEDVEVDIGLAHATARFALVEETSDTATAIGLRLEVAVDILGVAGLTLGLSLSESACERGVAQQPAASSLAPARGPETGGTTVQVSGARFVPGHTGVRIGPHSVPAGQVDVVDASTLVFTTPPHPPGTVGVRVQTPGGTTTTPLAFTYEAVGGPGDPDDPGDPGEPGDPAGRGLVRLWGADRIETAIAISRDQFGDGEANAVVLARSTDYPDALAGTPLAVREHAPLLLTPSRALDARTEQEIRRVLAIGGRVYLLGLTVALGPAVEERVAALGYETVRLGGASRFETAIAIAEQGIGDPAVLMIATGLDFADAVAGGAAAGVSDGAVLLTIGDRMHPATDAYVAANTALPRFALGGPAARADGGAVPVVGATRFETAVGVAETFFDSPGTVAVATGMAFPDALTGGAHVAREGGPVLLNPTTTLHPAAAAYQERGAANVHTAYLYGGHGALGPAVEPAVRAAAGLP